jgi:hypothetical protein
MSVAAAEEGRAARRREAATRPLMVKVGSVSRGTPAQRMSQPLKKSVDDEKERDMKYLRCAWCGS